MANALEKDLFTQAPASAKVVREYFSSVREAINNPSDTTTARAPLRWPALIGSGLTQEQLDTEGTPPWRWRPRRFLRILPRKFIVIS